MSIAAYKTAIAAWVEAQSGLTAQWRDEAGGWQAKTRARLHLKDFQAVGVDVIQWDQDVGLPAGSDLVPTFSGNREMTLTILVTSRDQSGSGVAAHYLEKLRTSLRKPSVKASLRAAGLAYSTVEATVDLDHWSDDRLESMGSLDVHFNAIENEPDASEAGSFVETFGVASTMTTPAGDDAGWPDKDLP